MTRHHTEQQDNTGPLIEAMNITCPCTANNGSTVKQLNTIVRHLSKHLKNSRKIIGKALEEIPKILEILSESFEEDLSVVYEKGVLCSEHLNPLEVERRSWDNCTVPCCVFCAICALKEQGVIHMKERIKESPARDSVDVVQGAKDTELKELKTKTFACECPKHKRGDTNSKDEQATLSISRNKKSEYFKNGKLTDGIYNQGEKEAQSLTTSAICARKSFTFQDSTQNIGDEIKGRKILKVRKNDLEDSKLLWSSSSSDTGSQKRCLQVNDKNLSAGSLVLSAIEKFSIVLQSVMEGIESCSDLATNLTSENPKLAASPKEMSEEWPSQDALVTSYSSFDFSENGIGNSFKGELQEGPQENAVKIFDFAAEESERVPEHPEAKDSDSFGKRDSNNEETFQVDVEAEFSNNSIRERPSFDNFGDNEGPHRGSSTSSADPDNRKESSRQKQNGVRRNKSAKTDRGFKFFKKKIFSKSMKSNPTKNNKSGSKDSLSWDNFSDGVGSTTADELPIEDHDGKNAVCYCDAPGRITELENTIKQLENKKSDLEGEKLDLMNALSNNWIEMEDLKNSIENDQENVDRPLVEDKTATAVFREIDHEDDTGSDIKMNNNSSGLKRMSKSEETCPKKQEGPTKVDLENQIKALTKAKSLQNETLHSLRIKLSVVNEDKENLSRKLKEMFEKNEALGENLQKVSGKTKQELDKILEENISFRSRLESLSSDKLLLEKNNQKLKIEKKKHKLMKLQIQQRCDNLIHRINETMQTTNAGQVNEVPWKPKDNPSSSKSNNSFEKSLTSSEEISNVDKNVKDGDSVKQIVRKLERSNSIDLTEVGMRGKVMKEAPSRELERGERAPVSVRRAETLNSKSVNSDLTDGKRKEVKVTRFPPAKPSKGDKILKDLKSSSGNEIGFRSTVPDTQGTSPRSAMEKESDPCLKFFDHLQAKCVMLLERFTVLNGKVEGLERHGDIYDSKSLQGMCASTQSSPDIPASFNTVPAQNKPQKDVVLLSCLRNLQQENDKLKLDNLKYKALVANMQEKWNGDLSERMESEITAEKNSIRRAEKNLQDLELRVVPVRDVGLLENMAESEGKENKNQLLEDVEEDALVGKTMRSWTKDSGEVRIEPHDTSSAFSGRNHLEEDISSWHRRHSKKSKEGAKALAENESGPMKIRQATSFEQIPNLQDTCPKIAKRDVNEKCDDMNPINNDRQQIHDKHILRALSLDEGKALMSNQPGTNESLENGLQRHEKDTTIVLNKAPSDKPVQNSAKRCCKSFDVNGRHHEHCSFMASLRKMNFDKATEGYLEKTSENNGKTLKKEMSTYGSRERPYKVHYV